MEMQIKELIEQIKKDGVSAAQDEANAIIEGAKAEAEKIITDAKAEAQKLNDDTKAKCEGFVHSSEEAIKQAFRNLLISFRESVSSELDAIIAQAAKNNYSADTLAKLIAQIVESWTKEKDSDDIKVFVSPNDLKRVESALLTELGIKLREGIFLEAKNNLDAGFQISTDGGRVYYDYSAESVAQMLSSFVSPALLSIMKGADEK